MARRRYNLLTKWLHIGIASCIVLSLFFTLLMSSAPTSGLPSLATVSFNLHKFVGINAFVLIFIYLLWAANSKAKSLDRLFPWLSFGGYKRLLIEIFRLFRSFELEYWAGAIQGLGILTAAVSAGSGVVLILDVIFPQLLDKRADLVINLHIESSHLLWYYLAIHISAAFFHWLTRQAQIFRIFDLLERRPKRHRQLYDNPFQK